MLVREGKGAAQILLRYLNKSRGIQVQGSIRSEILKDSLLYRAHHDRLLTMRHFEIRWKDLPLMLGVAVFYALFTYGVQFYLKSDTAVSVFEPSAGLALAALLLGGRRYALSVFLGDVAST